MRRSALLGALLVALVLAAPAMARASRGVVTLHYKLYMGGYNLAELPDGRLVASALMRRGGKDKMALLRFSRRGKLDRRFGRRGLAEVLVGGGYFTDPTAMLVLPDGRIVIAGTIATSKELAFGTSAIGGARFSPAGRLDRTFGAGGKATWTAGDGADGESWLLRNPDGSVLLIDNTQEGGSGGGVPNGCVLPLDSELRWAPSNPGFCSVPPGMGFGEFGDAVSDGAGGAIIAVRGEKLSSGPVFGIARVDAAGALDRTFATDGYNTEVSFGPRPKESVLLGGRSVAPRAGGGWIVGGAAPTAFGLAGFTAQGSLDPGFGNGGKLVLDPDPTPDPEILTKLVPLRDGRTLVMGFTFAEKSGKPRRGVMAVIRPDGSLDPRFGQGGKLVLTGRSLGIDEVDSLYSAIEQKDGRIVVLGTAYRRRDANVGLLLYRLRSNGRLDRSFGR